MNSKQLLFSVPFINLNGQFLLLLSHIGGAIIAPNGAAIKQESVTRRIPAGRDCPLIARQFFGGRNERSMERFLPSSCKYFEFYECRDTMLLESRSPVPLDRFC